MIVLTISLQILIHTGISPTVIAFLTSFLSKIYLGKYSPFYCLNLEWTLPRAVLQSSVICMIYKYL